MHIKITSIPVQQMRPSNLEVHRGYYSLHEYIADGFQLHGQGSMELESIGVTNCLLLEKDGVKYVCSFGEEPATLIIDQTLPQVIDGHIKMVKEQYAHDQMNIMDIISKIQF